MKRVSLALALILITSIAAFAAPPRPGRVAVATFAAGCFWCSEHDLQEVPGVISVVSGYTGGRKQHPTYEEVSAGGTGHFESVEVRYDPARVSYEQLLDRFWHDVDPFDAEGQFCDKGSQYRSVIFVRNAEERRLAEASKAAVEKRFNRRVATLILPASQFWPAEEYHQNYAEKNPVRYKFYRYNCGRDRRLDDVWGTKR